MRIGAGPAPALSLPTELSQPLQDLGKAVILFYGPYKIGKSTLAAAFPNALHLFFELGGRGMQSRQRFVPTWKDFRGYVDLVVKQDDFPTVIIDTVDKAYDGCMQYVTDTTGWVQGDQDFGKGWSDIKKEFNAQMDKIVASDRGIIFISHATEKEFQTKGGERFEKIIPTMGKQARTVAAAGADVIGYYSYWGKERMLEIGGHQGLDAGIRLKYNFWTPGDKETRQRIQAVPMGKDEDEGYENLLKAFRNEQENPYNEQHKPQLTEYAVKKPRRV